MQIKDVGIEILIPTNTDWIPVQQNGITGRISRENFLAGVGNGQEGVVLPTSFSHWHDESIVENGGAIQTDTNAGIAYGVESYQNPAANGDKFSFNRLLAAGNYKINIITVRVSAVGILKLDIDGVTAFDDMDCYSPSTITNAVLSRNITIATRGLHKFTWTINGKNASSSNYYFSGRKIWGVKI
jgi:hypothetical protein